MVDKESTYVGTGHNRYIADIDSQCVCRCHDAFKIIRRTQHAEVVTDELHKDVEKKRE